ncbi:MAG: type II secretion system protein [Phycisphaerales bacterium]
MTQPVVGGAYCAGGLGRGSRQRRGFSLLDLLVTIAVIGVLMGIMLPAMSAVSEMTRRVVCRSNARQIGIGLQLYAEQNKDRLPASVYSAALIRGQFRPEEMTALHTAGARGNWDGLGWLFAKDFLSAPEIFYCPAHQGDIRFEVYADQWQRLTGLIRGNYHLRALPPSDAYLHGVAPSTVLLADSIRASSESNHLTGLNLLRADLSVGWWTDDKKMLASILPSVASQPNSDLKVAEAWWLLDTGKRAGFPGIPWAQTPNTNPIGAGTALNH